MARKKAAPEPVSALVRALVSFEGYRAGELYQVLREDERAASLVDAGLLEVIDDGTGETGPGATEPGDSGGGPEGAPAEGPAGTEQGQDFGSGGYGAPAQ